MSKNFLFPIVSRGLPEAEDFAAEEVPDCAGRMGGGIGS